MKNHTKINKKERGTIARMLAQDKKVRDIAKVLKRNQRTIAREYERNKYAGQEYIPCKAQEISDKRAVRQRTKAPLKNPQVFLYVRVHLRMRWSPEIIAGRLKVDIPGESITPETIYQYIYGKGRKYKLHIYLAKSYKKRRIKTERSVHKEQKHSRIPEAISIDKQPTKANNRAQAGHFETDLMEGPR